MVLTLGRTFRCYWIIIWFYKVDTASSTRCYCSISRINNRRFSPHNNLSAWTMHSPKSTHSHSTLSHTDTYRLGASLCYSATNSITGENVRHLEWVRNSCYCIERQNLKKAIFILTLIVHVCGICCEIAFRAAQAIALTDFNIFNVISWNYKPKWFQSNQKWSRPGPWFNIKMSSYQYRKSHCGDKTVVRSSYLHNGISYTGKMSSLYWIRALTSGANDFANTPCN